MSRSDEEQLVEFLADRDAPCPLCGYNLRALTSPQCPECGREIVLAVGMTEPYLRAWVTTLVMLALAAGLGVFWIVMLMGPGPPPWPAIYFFSSFLMSCAAIPLMIILVIVRRRFLRLARAVQWAAAGLSAASSLCAFGSLVVGFLF